MTIEVEPKKSKSTNNGKRRRTTAEKAKPLGKKVAYNENAPRSVVRRLLNSWAKCEYCGDRLLVKNLDEHVRKALLHKKTRVKK